MKPTTFVEKVVDKIIKLGLTAPAILLLEAHKPLAFLGSQFLLVMQPTLEIFLSKHYISDVIELLADSERLETLITHLEANAAASPPASKLSGENHT